MAMPSLTIDGDFLDATDLAEFLIIMLPQFLRKVGDQFFQGREVGRAA
jgi:hypothetical protein